MRRFLHSWPQEMNRSKQLENGSKRNPYPNGVYQEYILRFFARKDVTT